LRRLARALAHDREQRAALEGTLRLLAPQQAAPQQGPPPLVRLPRDSAQRIAATLGGQWNEEAVQSHAPIFAAFLQELAAPLLLGLDGIADTVVLVQDRQEGPQYPSVPDDAGRAP